MFLNRNIGLVYTGWQRGKQILLRDNEPWSENMIITNLSTCKWKSTHVHEHPTNILNSYFISVDWTWYKSLLNKLYIFCRTYCVFDITWKDVCFSRYVLNPKIILWLIIYHRKPFECLFRSWALILNIYLKILFVARLYLRPEINPTNAISIVNVFFSFFFLFFYFNKQSFFVVVVFFTAI